MLFRSPSDCADQLASGAADIGIVPSFELTRQDLEIIPGAGIACHGAVRSILLVSSRPADGIRSLALDSSSRTSVELVRVLLERRYGVVPQCVSHAPDLDAMMRIADAALIIGDPALRIDSASLPWQAMPAPGMISRSCRVNSKEGTMPISAAPEANWSAQSEGRRNSRSNRSRCGPWSMPHTRGEVFR